MALFHDARDRLQRREKRVALGFNKYHIFNSYKYKLPVNSVDIFFRKPFIKTTRCAAKMPLKPLLFARLLMKSG